MNFNKLTSKFYIFSVYFFIKLLILGTKIMRNYCIDKIFINNKKKEKIF
jgi:hypothetical protein